MWYVTMFCIASYYHGFRSGKPEDVAGPRFKRRFAVQTHVASFCLSHLKPQGSKGSNNWVLGFRIVVM